MFEKDFKIGPSNRYWVTNDDYIPISEQPDEGYTKMGAIQRAQREVERITNNKRWNVSISDASKLFHIMDSDGNICHDLDDAI